MGVVSDYYDTATSCVDDINTYDGKFRIKRRGGEGIKREDIEAAKRKKAWLTLMFHGLCLEF